jgi:serine phosphatase RsbU (regulator of sigma subunit)
MKKIEAKFLEEYYYECDLEVRLEKLADFTNYYFESQHPEVVKIIESELENSLSQNNINGESLTRFLLAYAAYEKGNMAYGLKQIEKIHLVFDQVNNLYVRALLYNFFAFTNSHQGNHDKAFYYAYESIKTSEKLENNPNRFWGIYSLGVFYFDIKDYSNSEKHYREALEKFLMVGNQYGCARARTGIASIYIQQNKLDEAEEIETGQSRSLNDLATIYKKQNRLDEAITCFEKALEIRRKNKHAQGIATTLIEIGEVLILQKKFDQVLNYLIEAKEACELVKNKNKLFRTHYLFVQLYKNMNEPWKALEHYEIYEQIKSEVAGENTNHKINELQKKAAVEKSEQETEIHRLKNVELKHAYEEIAEKNKEILDSISYAKRLQQAILPSQEMVDTYLPHNFILYKPKDIVAGDFYWAEHIEDKFYIAAADSTGHGVPGALVSVVCSNALNRAVKEFHETIPGKILDKARELVIETFEKSNSDVKDGMDISLLCIDKENERAYWTGANNPLWYFQNNTLIEITADKQPIGKTENPQAFTTHAIDIKDETIFYLFTDGLADQFGGPKGKKFKYKQFSEILQGLHTSKLQEQESVIEKAFEEWKGELEQVDDVCVIGIKI